MVDLSALPEVLVGYYAAKGAFPQEVARLKKAIARIGGPALENLASRIKSNTAERKAISDINAEIIAAARNQALQIAADEGRVGRAIAHNVEDLIHKQSNREKILHLAVKQLSMLPSIENRDDQVKNDDDWLNAFSDMAAQKSNPDIQALWAKILAGEIRKPKSFSLQSLRLLSAIDAEDAALIHDILGLSIAYKHALGVGSFIFKFPAGQYIDKYLQCESLGILIGTSGRITEDFKCDGVLVFWTSKTKIVANFDFNSIASNQIIQIDSFPLTRFGKELRTLSSDLTCDPDYESQFVEFLERKGAKVQREQIKKIS